MNDLIKEKVKKLPLHSGVYVMFNSDGQVIYVGKAKNLKNRVSQYFNHGQKLQKVQNMVDKVFNFEFYLTFSERDAFALENNLIKKYQPFYNILLKDDKTYPYIKVDLKDDYPYFQIVRKIKKDGAKYFGPYISGISPYALLDVIHYAFPLRNCKRNISGKIAKKECLNYHLGLCSAPCTNRINKNDYKKLVMQAVDFLNGNSAQVERILETKMNLASETENFETALILRDNIKMVKRLKEKVVANLPNNYSCDVVAYFSDGFSAAIVVVTFRLGKILGVNAQSVIDASMQNGEAISSFIMQYYEKNLIPSEILVSDMLEEQGELEKILSEMAEKKVVITCPQIATKKHLVEMAIMNAIAHIEQNTSALKREHEKTIGALEHLKTALSLSRVPLRIECYDISNLSGTNVVSSMVVFKNGKSARKHYRKFKIKSFVGQDDFASMNETLGRRLNELELQKDMSFSEKPDLIIIDGGKGQLSSAISALEKANANIDIISLAKRAEEVYLPNLSEPIFLTRNSPELYLIERVRDEAHRFAITFHRNLRNKNFLSSPLDNIKGVGKVKKEKLLNHFKTIDAIKDASLEEIELVHGIDKNLAKKIFDYFSSTK